MSPPIPAMLSVPWIKNPEFGKKPLSLLSKTKECPIEDVIKSPSCSNIRGLEMAKLNVSII